MSKIVILGAGLTGLSTAYHLEKKGFFDYKLFEKEKNAGGLCRSISQDGFTFDYTGHLLHINNDYFKSFIKNIVGFTNFNTVIRHSFIYSNNIYTDYPFQINLHGLPDKIITECVEGFIKRKNQTNTPSNYHEWILQTFGTGFGDHFFFPYQKKIFSYDTKKLTHSWTGRFVPKTTLQQIISGAIRKKNEQIGYNATFYYPKQGGTISWIKKIEQQLINKVEIDFCAKSIDCKNKIIHFKNGHSEPFEKIISTIPLNNLIESLQETSTTNLKPAAKKLICTSVINFNLGISKQKLSNKSWIYFPEKQFPFYRIGFPHTFSSKMTPKNCSSLYGEISYLKESKENITNKAIEKTKQIFKIKSKEIITKNIITIPNAYVIYNHWREKNIESIHTKLIEQNIYSIGRYGEWKYSSMQEAVLDGKKVATIILNQPPTLKRTNKWKYKKEATL